MNRLSASKVEKGFLPQLTKLEEATKKRDIDTIKEILDTLPPIQKFPEQFRELLVTARNRYMWEAYREDIRKLLKATEKRRSDRIKSILKRIPSKRKLPGPYDMFVEDAEKILEQEKETNKQTKRVEEVPEELQEDQASLTVSSIEQLYSRRLRKYKARIKLATNLLEEGKLEKAKNLIEDFTLKGCPTDGTEQDLRYLKEELGIK